MANFHGVKIKSFHADNGVYTEKALTDEVANCGQTISFCGAGAHHQNVVAEHHIGRLTRGSRNNLIHVQRQWPEAIGEILWPFAWKYYERRYNDLSLDKNGLSPLQKKSNVYEPFKIRDYRTFGCPVYILNEKFQAVGSKFLKWQPRSHLGVYLGWSPCHP